jgi:hypothetical protein
VAASFCIAMIWLRPEVIKNADPQSLCRLSCTSKTLRSDLQGIKAWARLAEAQYPPPTPRDDDEARSHVRRREVAKHSPPTLRVLEGVTLLEALSRPAPAPVAYTPNELSDFTFFLRLTDGGRLCWEGDLECIGHGALQAFEGTGLRLSLRHVDFGWLGPADNADLQQVQIALVAIRNHDQGMVLLGRFDFYAAWSDSDGDPRNLRFRPRRSLFHSPRSQLNLWPCLSVGQDANDRRLELKLYHVILPPPQQGGPQNSDNGDESQFRHVLSYLAGIPAGRASALATIESLFVAAEREPRFGWLEHETRQVTRRYDDTVLREQDEIEAARAEAQFEREREEAEYAYDRNTDGLDGAFISSETWAEADS